jgi:hypothetical protein
MVVSAADRRPYEAGEIRQTITLYRLRWGTGQP